MKQLLILLLLLNSTLYSQEFKNVDAKVLNYSRFSKVENLANQIEKDFSTDIDKVRAAFFWLTKNIRYDLKEFYNPKQRHYSFSYSTIEEREQKLQTLKDNLVRKAFASKKGVCEEYAQAFKKTCDLLGIEAEVIKGYVRNDAREIDKITNTTNHAWNAVKINGDWLILDATWAAGYELNGRWIREFNNYFFNMPKDKIFKTHYPEDSIWVLRFGRMSLSEFYNQPIYNKTFLDSNIKLISPLAGKINLYEIEKLEFKFKNLNTPIYYLFKGNKYLKKAKSITKGELTTIEIEKPKNNTSVIFFINKRSAIHFLLIK